jgi:chorismate mutase
MQLMKQVASYKSLHHLPVEDLPREKVVLESMLKNARQAGIEPHSVQPFVHALMNVSKAIQYRYLSDWWSTQENQPVRNLADTRQQIQQLDSKLLTAISQRLMAGAFSEADGAWLNTQLTAAHLSEADKNALIVSLSRIKRMH